MVDLVEKDAVEEIARRLSPEHGRAFTRGKQVLTEPPVLHFPEISREFVIHVDASEAGAGAFLAQENEDTGDLSIVAYFSQRFHHSQRYYSATQKECYAVVLAIQHIRLYLWGTHFVCVTDHAALRYLYCMQDTSDVGRWAIALQQSSLAFLAKEAPQMPRN